MKILPGEIWYIAKETLTGREYYLSKDCYENGVGVKEEFEIIATVNDDPRVHHEFFMYGHAEIN